MQTIGMAVGAVCCGIVALEALSVSVRWWLRTARRQRQLVERQSEFRRRYQMLAQRSRAARQALAWKSTRPFRVSAIVDEALDVKSLYLTPVDARPLPPYEPGQYVTLHLALPDVAKPVVRCYSLSDRPREDYYRCTIKRLGALGTAPPGRASSFLHSAVEVGDVLQLEAPRGGFHVDPSERQPIVLLGAGIGVTPLWSMFNAILHAGAPRDVYAILGFHNSQHHPFKEAWEAAAATHANLRLHVNYSAPRAEDVLHHDFDAQGQITIERIQRILPSSNFHFYVCGPGPMMESLVPSLLEWGVPAEHIHFEAFGPASVRIPSGQAPPTALGGPCDVAFAKRGSHFDWDDSFASLLEFAEAHGLTLDSGCRAGNCGQCLIAIRSGKVQTIKQPGMPVAEGHCLTCVSVPAGPLVLDA